MATNASSLGQHYIEKFGGNVNQSPFKFFVITGRRSKVFMILPKGFSSYPSMDPSGSFATVRTRLGSWKIWCIRNNEGVIFLGPCWDSFVEAHNLVDYHMIQFDYYDELKDSENTPSHGKVGSTSKAFKPSSSQQTNRSAPRRNFTNKQQLSPKSLDFVDFRRSKFKSTTVVLSNTILGINSINKYWLQINEIH
ncbi:hypothetical protein ACJIZ3_005905 [Penstemon smallii]|uniref:TF-B3 domain-containing protein n=1 Tax=Penstemon smallii TaxID=265156 RepID=A0ABD3S6G4_9LAMI